VLYTLLPCELLLRPAEATRPLFPLPLWRTVALPRVPVLRLLLRKPSALPEARTAELRAAAAALRVPEVRSPL
jgi:hypothetical protein